MTDKCTHESTIVLFCEGDVTVSRCTWLCGEVLISTLDGITTTTRTVGEVKADEQRLEDAKRVIAPLVTEPDKYRVLIYHQLYEAAAKWMENNK